jgi:hypothetical protein
VKPVYELRVQSPNFSLKKKLKGRFNDSRRPGDERR